MSATYVPAHWNNFVHLAPYRRNNSLDGIRYAAAVHLKSGRAIDLDMQLSRGGTFLNTHWATPAIEGFRYTTGKHAGKVCRIPFGLMSARLACSLRTEDGYGIQTGGHALARAAERRVRVEVELKAVPSLADMQRLAAVAEAYYGPDWQQWVQVKMLARFRWRTALRRAKRAGFITFLIGFKGDPSTLPAYIDHYRK